MSISSQDLAIKFETYLSELGYDVIYNNATRTFPIEYLFDSLANGKRTKLFLYIKKTTSYYGKVFLLTYCICRHIYFIENKEEENYLNIYDFINQDYSINIKDAKKLYEIDKKINIKRRHLLHKYLLRHNFLANEIDCYDLIAPTIYSFIIDNNGYYPTYSECLNLKKEIFKQC